MHQSSRLERVVRTLGRQRPLGDGTKLVVDEGEQALQTLRVVAGLREEDRHRFGCFVLGHVR